MKKFIGILLSASLLFGCSKTPTIEHSKENYDTFEETKGIVEETIAIDEEINEEPIDTEDKAEVVTVEKGGLLDYRPKVGSKMTYSSGEEELFVYEIIAKDEQHIQVSIFLGGNPTTQIYKWTTSEITLLYEEPAPSDPYKNRLSDFKQMTNPDTLINLEGSATWQLISDSEAVTVPFGTFANVFVIEKVTDDVADADTIFRKYFAPEVGLIKETFEVTGEHGYKGEAVLEIVE
ncbi:hypothetical protein H1D32_07730 [Anaerobacillus sp. CMMVII]|uniref:hypothetical protein n=1 Tax=Anaerobacillus sp. CMMVII TaxID=2755588 RepID=UPI0021B7C27D|nr:hypothetical protein [Anaerobacillus sp. CMMVII]MCT8137652.1 hypothetical protein [Anaerobacillus sp. CMMVII]